MYLQCYLLLYFEYWTVDTVSYGYCTALHKRCCRTDDSSKIKLRSRLGSRILRNSWIYVQLDPVSAIYVTTSPFSL